MKTQYDLEKMLDELLDAEGGLSGKEIDFLDNLNNNYRGRITKAQADWLEKIWNRILGQEK